MKKWRKKFFIMALSVDRFFRKINLFEIYNPSSKGLCIESWFVPDLRMRQRQAIYPRLPLVQTSIFHLVIFAKSFFASQWIQSVFSVQHGKMQWLPLTRKHLCTYSTTVIYRKVANSRLSQLVAHSRIFRLFMKGKFDAYVQWPLAETVQNWIVDRSNARDFTVYVGSRVYCTKGQLISKCPFGVFKSLKKPTKFFPGFLPYS